MRHLWSFLGGLAAAPLCWLLIAIGQATSADTLTGWVDSDRYETAYLIGPAIYLLAGGIVLGVLGTLRISPAGPITAGLLLIAPYAAMFANPFAVRDAVPSDWRVVGEPLPLRLPLENGTLALVGVGLVVAAASVQRWRAWPAPRPVPTFAFTPGGPLPTRPPTPPDPAIWSARRASISSSAPTLSEPARAPGAPGGPMTPAAPVPSRAISTLTRTLTAPDAIGTGRSGPAGTDAPTSAGAPAAGRPSSPPTGQQSIDGGAAPNQRGTDGSEPQPVNRLRPARRTPRSGRG